MNELRPTIEAYAELQQAYDHFNGPLFDGRLPPCLITLQRERRSFGYFSAERFARRSGEMTDEIAMNPSFFGVRAIEQSLSTLAHEMVHLWQHHFGTPGRRGYHNLEWADAMEKIGLMPSNTGAPGGRRVGERMTHYIVEGGRFSRSCAELLTREFTLSWLDRFPPFLPSAPPTEIDAPGPAVAARFEGGDDLVSSLVELPPEDGTNRSNRTKYRCPHCKVQVWGKPNLNLLCGDCQGCRLEAIN